jgi:hypothetical protein
VYGAVKAEKPTYLHSTTMIKKTILPILLATALLPLASGMALAAKPIGNNAGAVTYAWHLSGDVMPVPPYGSLDILGSDTASELIVNQPNGNVAAMVTGDMNGLHPNTTYTVYLSNTYIPYKVGQVAGSYTMDVLYSGRTFTYDLTLSQSGTTITGDLYDQYLPGHLAVSGTVNGNTVTFSVTYPTNYQGTRTFTGTIASGNLSGTWSETGSEHGSSTWFTTGGSAIMGSGNSNERWPGQLSGTTPFTFTTDDTGSGSWHYNFTGSAPPSFSVWVNEAGRTILISDNVLIGS